MVWQTLIDVPTLAQHHDDPGWVLIDCRFSLADPGEGARRFAYATIPGALYAHLDDDLSGPIVEGQTGRHPLPTREAWVATLGGWGITPSTQVVGFDDMGGAFAARLWWMLRWVGHHAAAVLDGGLPAWTAGGHALAPGQPPSHATTYAPQSSSVEAVTAAQVLAALDDASTAVLDARSAARFRGEGETVDPIAGHIAGARSAPWADNLDDDGRFRAPSQLAARFTERLGSTDPGHAIVYCGSGVTACHDLLAMTHAGLPTPRLYPGSWSEWITDPARPRATGDET